MTRNRLALPILAILTVAVVAIIATSGAGSKTTNQNVSGAGSAISVRQTPIGRVLVDASGRTLYLFAGDTRNLSRLSAAGRAIWPPLLSTAVPVATGGAVAAKIATIPAGSGTRQVTYNGHPLYYYVGDHAPGQTSGQGLNEFGALWYTVSPTGRAIVSARRATSSGGAAGYGSGSSGAGGGGSYGY
jgi:predicted lipoprotein with Yx(FWY)xxD motif